MKKITKVLSLLLLICMIVTSLVACDEGECTHQKVVGGVCQNCGEPVEIETKDWATEVALDMTSTATKKAEVTLKLHVDGDTVHFYAPTVSEADGGVVKARFLAIDTPESTGRIEEWGKKASTLQKPRLLLQARSLLSLTMKTGTWTPTADSFFGSGISPRAQTPIVTSI